LPHPGVFRVNNHVSIHEPGRAHTGYGNLTERPGLLCLNAPWITDPSGTANRDDLLTFDNSLDLADNKLWRYDPLVIRVNYRFGDDGIPYAMNPGVTLNNMNRGISFRYANIIPNYGLSPAETTHIGPHYSVFGSSLADSYTHSSMTKPVSLTVGSTATYNADKLVYQMCVRGKIICHSLNNGYSNYTLFHCVE
jgi:hypothetical protein